MPETRYFVRLNFPSQQNPETFSEVSADSNPSTVLFFDSDAAFNASLVLFSIFTITLLSSGVNFFKKARVQKKSDSQLSKLQSFQKIPCSKCRYFNSNPYLKCAVNPSVVLKDEAINCPEYHPKPTISSTN